MAEHFFVTRAAITAVYIVGLVLLTSIGIWDITNIIGDYTMDNRITIVKPINITDRFPFLLSNIKVCLDYPGQAIYPQRLQWDELFPILRASWKDQLKNTDKSENASAWERILKEAVPDFYMYYVIGDIDRSGPDMDYSNSVRPFIRQAFLDAVDLNETELYSIIDEYITNPEKLLQMKQALEILRFYLGGIVLTDYTMSTVTVPTYFATNTSISSVVAEEGCFRIHIPRYLTLENPRVTYAYILTTGGMKPYIPAITFNFPEMIRIGLRSDITVTVIITNIAVTDSRNFPPCTLEYETEEECLEDIAIKIIVEVCKCVPLTRVAGGSIDLSSPRNFCTVATYKKCWQKAMEEVSWRQAEIRREKTCLPCMTSKNSYSAVTKDQDAKTYVPPVGLLEGVEKENFTSWPSTQALVHITCPDREYILLQDKQQYSLSQFISQIGGDLGLYIGFSMISFLEAALFVYHMYHNRRQPTGEGTWADGFRYIIRFLFRNFNTARYNDIERLTKNRTATMPVESIFYELKSIRDEMRKAHAKQSEINMELKKGIQKLNDKIGVSREYKGNRGVWRT